MSITAADPRALATSKVSCIQAMVAALRAANSAGLGAVSHRLLQDPCMFSVAKVTPARVQRRCSTHGTGPLTPRQSGVDCTSMRIRFWPSENGVLKNKARSWSRRSSDENPPLEGRSQSVQSLSPVVKTAGAFKELKNPRACVYKASTQVVGRDRTRCAVAGSQIAIVDCECEFLLIHVRD